jgi:hypothetical protein
MRKLFALACVCFVCLSSFSQKNYKSATVVTANGETITGEIDYRNWEENPSTIWFRKDQSSQPTAYTTDNLESFSVEADVYKKAIIEIAERRDYLNHLVEGDYAPTHMDTVFLLTIVTGPKSLYQYTDNANHFYIKNGIEFERLRYKKYKAKGEVLVASEQYASRADHYVVTTKEYLAQLREYLKDCASLSGDVKYDVKSLRKLFVSYYKCLGSNPTYLKKPENEKVELGVLAGVSNTSFKVNTERTAEIIGMIGFSSSTNFSAGGFFDIVFPRQRGRLSLNNEILYSAFKTEGSYRNALSPSIYDDYTFNFGYSYLKLNNMLRYKFFTNSMIIFINGGISNGIVLNEVNSMTKVHMSFGNKTESHNKGFNDTRKHEAGFLAGAGLRKNKVTIEIRGEKGLGPFKSPAFKADVMRYFLLIGYRLR